VALPVSAAILDRIDDYRVTLESTSKRLLPLIRWGPTETGNVRVIDDTGKFLAVLRRDAARRVSLRVRRADDRD
jgi:hypothetical protein